MTRPYTRNPMCPQMPVSFCRDSDSAAWGTPSAETQRRGTPSVEISTSRNQEGHQRNSREPCTSLRNYGDMRIAQAAASGIGGVGCVTTTSYQSRLPDSDFRRHNCASTPLPGGHQNPSGPYDARKGDYPCWRQSDPLRRHASRRRIPLYPDG